MKQIEFEEVISLLPASATEIAQHFPDSSLRGIRNKLNQWVAEEKIFRSYFECKTRGRPINKYTGKTNGN
ncbi:hypothetical protein ACE1CD_15590 [Aerosakkonema sp. BLCC-F183]|uniref:hypothetical protein n=1 Tax=Aerosakkonema sp. BLCC-F183 TaxID=3342834 RepID=UPI0035B8704B